MKKKVLILTLNDYIIYQPTILNLYDHLSASFDVTVVSFQPKFVTKKKDEERNIIYLETSPLVSEIYQKADFIFSKLAKVAKKAFKNYNYYYLYYNKYLPGVLKSFLKKNKVQADIVIAVDLQTLYLAQTLYGSVHFLSLEIDNNTNKFYKKIDTQRIKSVFVQSQMRYDYLFPNAKLKTFIVQNAPVFNGRPQISQERRDFIWAGAIDRRLAIIECIEFFNKYQQYKLVMKGGGDKKTKKIIEEQYAHLLEKGVIEFNQEYLPGDEFVNFLTRFKIGFCFYDWSLIHGSFNYLTAPSGKIFMYFAAGTPVIACNIPGFDFVKEFGAGVLIDDYEPETILKAMQEIEKDFRRYSEGAFKVAEHFNFDKNVQSYIDYLKQESAQ